jgi:nitroreductase
MSFISHGKWRYATKKFNKEQKISSENLEILKDAIQLAPTSYGLQLFKVLIIENPLIKEKLREASWNQSQLEDASHIFVFCNYTEVKRKHLDEYLIRRAELHQIEASSLSPYADFIEKKLRSQNTSEIDNWTAKQTYIALSFLMNAAAELKIDTCPIEGFEAERYREILGLDKQGLSAAVVAAVGYRAAEDKQQFMKKVRKRNEDLFELR